MTPEQLMLVGGILAAGLGVWLLFHFRPTPRTSSTSFPVPVDKFRATPSDELIEQLPAQRSADALILGDIEDPLLEITPTDLSDQSVEPIEMDSSILRALQPVLQRAPEFFRLGGEMTTKTYRLVFSPAVTRALNKGTLELVPSSGELLPVVRKVGNPKKFVKLGRVVTTGGIRLANVAAASWQIAAIATAQHYLAEINERLQRIDDRLKDIQFFQQEEKRAEIRGAIQLLKQYHDAISRAALHPHEIAAIYQKLEDIEERCLAVGELGRRLAEEEFKKLDAIVVKEIRDPMGTERRSGEWLNRCKEMLELVYLAESCRMVACHVKAALPGDRVLIEKRIEDIKLRVRASAEHVTSLQEQFHQKIVRPLDPSGDRFRKLFHYRDHGIDAANTFERVSGEVIKMAENLDMQAERARGIAQHFEQLADSGLALEVSLDQNGDVKVLSAQSA